MPCLGIFGCDVLIRGFGRFVFNINGEKDLGIHGLYVFKLNILKAIGSHILKFDLKSGKSVMHINMTQMCVV